MYKILFIIAGLFLASCNLSSEDKLKDSLVKETKDKSIFSDLQQLRNKLIGMWTDGSTENATFDIRKDSIFYVEHFETYKYKLTTDSIYIHYPDFIYSGKIAFKGDTLILSSEDGESKFWRFKD